MRRVRHAVVLLRSLSLEASSLIKLRASYQTTR